MVPPLKLCPHKGVHGGGQRPWGFLQIQTRLSGDKNLRSGFIKDQKNQSQIQLFLLLTAHHKKSRFMPIAFIKTLLAQYLLNLYYYQVSAFEMQCYLSCQQMLLFVEKQISVTLVLWWIFEDKGTLGVPDLI